MGVVPIFAFLALFPAGGKGGSSIHWLENDFEGAKKKALGEGKLVAVDTWAAWCHGCLAMHGYVFSRPEMGKVKDAHVWLKLDFDNPKTAQFFEQYPTNFMPTFYLIDPKTGDVVRRWVGAATLDEMLGFFSTAPDAAAFVEAREAIRRGDAAHAKRIYAKALETADATTRGRLVSEYIELLWTHDPAACAREGMKYLDRLSDTTQGLDAVGMLGSCALSLEDEAERKRVAASVRDRLARAVANAKLPLTADARSSYYTSLIEMYDLLGQEKEATTAVEKHVALLEDAWKSASTPVQRSTYVWPMTESYLRLGKLAEAERLLVKSEQDGTRDFNHTAWLAMVYSSQGKVEKGLKTIDRALTKGYGGRKLRLYSIKIGLMLQKRDLNGADKVVEQAQAHLAKTPANQVLAIWKAEFESRVSELEAAREQ